MFPLTQTSNWDAVTLHAIIEECVAMLFRRVRSLKATSADVLHASGISVNHNQLRLHTLYHIVYIHCVDM